MFKLSIVKIKVFCSEDNSSSVLIFDNRSSHGKNSSILLLFRIVCKQYSFHCLRVATVPCTDVYVLIT